MRLIDADALCEEFRMRQKAALNWKEGATLAHDEECIIRADATLAFLTEVKLTIDNAPPVETGHYLTNCQNCQSDYSRGYDDGYKEGYNAERSHGEWIFKEMTDDYRVYGQCSICKHRKRIDSYCPNCGAKMDKEVDNDK